MSRSLDGSVVPLPSFDEPLLPLLKPTREERLQQIQPVLDKLEQYNSSVKKIAEKFDRRYVERAIVLSFAFPLPESLSTEDMAEREETIRRVSNVLKKNPPLVGKGPAL